jgi:hypothetical protein
MSPKEQIIKTQIPILGQGMANMEQFIAGLNNSFAQVGVALNSFEARIKKLEAGRVNVDIKYEANSLGDLRNAIGVTKEAEIDSTSKDTQKV